MVMLGIIGMVTCIVAADTGKGELFCPAKTIGLINWGPFPCKAGAGLESTGAEAAAVVTEATTEA